MANNISILAIDDNLLSMQALLAGAFPGANILLAQTGQEGVRLALEADPDVILLDIVKPGMDGYEVCRILKADDRLRHIPVVFLTALLTGREHRVRALDVGAEGFISKPVDEIELIAQVRAMVKIKAAHVAQHLETRRLAGLVATRTRELEHEFAGRKQAEGALQQAHTELSAIHAQVPVALMLVDRERRILKLNVAAEQLAGRSRDQMIGARVGEAIRCECSLEDTCGCGFGSSCGSCPINRSVVDTFADELPRSGVEARMCLQTGGPEPDVRYLSIATAFLAIDGDSTVLVSAQDITEKKKAELALRASEKLHRSVINASPDDITITDLDGRILMVSPAALTLFGYDRPADLIGRTMSDLLVPEDVDRARDDFDRTCRGHRTAHAEYRGVRRDGSHINIEVNGDLIPDDDGKPSRMVLIVRDISDRKKTEEVLAFLARSSGGLLEEGFFRSLARFLGQTLDMDFICIDRLAGDQLTAQTVAVWCDGAFEDNVTYSLQDTPCGDVPGKAVCCFPSGVRALFPEDQVLRELKAEGYLGVTLWSHDGQPAGLIAAISRRPLVNRPLLETVLRMVAVRAGAELDRLEAERALRQQEERYRRVSAVMSDIAYSCVESKAGLYELDWVEGAVERLLGRSVEEIIGLKCWGTLVVPEDQPAFRRTVTGCALNTSGSTQLRLRHKDGSIRWVSVSVRCMERAGQPHTRELFGGITDITEQKQAEERLIQAQKMESVGRLAGGVAHDFNNLLTVINGYSEFLMNGCELDERARGYIVQIHKSGARAAALTQQMLAFSRKQLLQPQVLEFDQLFEDLSPMLVRLVGEDVQMEFHLNSQSATVHADPHQVGQVVMNLVVNARDAMPRGGLLRISTARAEWTPEDVRLRQCGRPGPYVVLQVTDSGVGMDDETRRRAFEPFFTTKKTGEGTGLGLPMVQGIVAQSNGFVEVQSEPGKGATFSVFLPIVEMPRTNVSDEVTVRVPGGSELILVVEDQKEVRTYVVNVLRSCGYRVLESGNGMEALRLLDTGTEKPDLLLADVVMPVLGGPELARQVHERQPQMKVLFMSGYTDHDAVREGAGGPAVHLIQKPFSPSQLALRIRETLGTP
ncbi:PAS domain S-box protein [uncultured Paludibaculum sp.]|uniref:PAS domain S-box protein n=1 Tax=uncultured Paludibaculum sp. TaxID=1765020 RepID=UPI002AABB870|nr:PAS domain S-box protein [uncultured Paludibaculum sp.]